MAMSLLAGVLDESGDAAQSAEIRDRRDQIMFNEIKRLQLTQTLRKLVPQPDRMSPIISMTENELSELHEDLLDRFYRVERDLMVKAEMHAEIAERLSDASIVCQRIADALDANNPTATKYRCLAARFQTRYASVLHALGRDQQSRTAYHQAIDMISNALRQPASRPQTTRNTAEGSLLDSECLATSKFARLRRGHPILEVASSPSRSPVPVAQCRLGPLSTGSTGESAGTVSGVLAASTLHG